MTTQFEREDVALPELIGLGPFEPALGFVTRFRKLLFPDEPSVMKDTTDRRFRHAKTLETGEHVADPARAPIGVLFARRQHCALRGLRCSLLLLALRRAPAVVLERP
jgi:hypothetical protein